MKHWSRWLVVLALAAALCVPAFAEEDPFYSGPLDNWTGEPVTDGVSSAPEEERLVYITDAMYYDRDRREFVYPTSAGMGQIFSNVADGMVVTDPVTVSADAGLTLSVYRDGEALENMALSGFYEPGEYVVYAKVGDRTEKLLRFQIVGASAQLPHGYSLPDGFFILDATRNGEETYYDSSYINMEDEGAYRVEYVCPDTGLHYVLETTVDRTPPEIVLEGKRDDQGRFHSAVDVAVEEGCAVAMTYNESPDQFPRDGHLTESGNYIIQATDAAGNTAARQFLIMVYFDFNSLLFFALLCLSGAAVLGYVLFKRRRRRII